MPLSPEPSLAPSSSRWHILALLFVCRTGLGVQFQTLGSVSDQLVAGLGLRYAEIGTLIGLFMLPGLVLALPAGWLGRHLPDRWLVVVGFACLSLGGMLAALASGFGLLALARLMAGVGFVFSTLYLTKMITDWFAGKELATALGILVTSWPLGIALAQLGHVGIARYFDWHAAFAISAAYCACGALGVGLLYRSPMPAAVPAPRGGAAMPAAAPGLQRPEWLLISIAAAVWGLYNAGYVICLSFAPQVLVAGGRSPAQAAAIISLASWVMIFSIALCGRIADRTGRRDELMYGCTAVAVGALLLLRHTEWAVVLSLLIGLLGAAPAGIIMALTAEAVAPQRRAFGMGVFFSIFFVIMALAPPLAGWLFDHSADPYWPVVFSASLFGGAALLYRIFRLAQRRLACA